MASGVLFMSFFFMFKDSLIKIKVALSSQVKSNLSVAHFMYKTIQSALHKIKALQQGAEKALKICKII